MANCIVFYLNVWVLFVGGEGCTHSTWKFPGVEHTPMLEQHWILNLLCYMGTCVGFFKINLKKNCLTVLSQSKIVSLKGTGLEDIKPRRYITLRNQPKLLVL